MSLVFNPNVPTGGQTIASTTIPINTNFASLESAFNAPIGGVTGGGKFTSYSLQATTTSFTAKPIDPIGVLYTTTSGSGHPELAYINNVNAQGAGPYTGTQITGGGVTAAAYCSFNSAGTLASGGYNVSSTVRNAQGIFTVNFTRNFANTNYIALPVPNCVSVGGFAIKIAQESKNINSFQFSIQNQVNAFVDPVTCDVVFFGILS